MAGNDENGRLAETNRIEKGTADRWTKECAQCECRCPQARNEPVCFDVVWQTAFAVEKNVNNLVQLNSNSIEFVTYIVVRRASEKLATKIDAMPKPCNTKPVIIVLSRDSMGKNEAGPIRQKPQAINVLPINADTFGCKHLSIIQPQNGAVTAYTAPLMMKIEPNAIGVKSNCRKWGSSVAPRKPIDTLVAMMLNELTMTPGILMIDDNFTDV